MNNGREINSFERLWKDRNREKNKYMNNRKKLMVLGAAGKR